MSEEKQLSLSDLGVEAVDTPAEKASRNAVNEKPINETNKPKIVKPSMLGDAKITQANIVTDINSIAEKPITQKENPVRKTLDSLYEMADKSIDRTKQEIMPRIDEAKRAYIQEKWELLERKAAKNPNVIALVVTPYPHSVYGCKWFTTRLLTYRRSASIYFPIRGSHAVAIMGAS